MGVLIFNGCPHFLCFSFIIPLHNKVVGGYIGFTPSVRQSCMPCLLYCSATIWLICFICTTHEWSMCLIPFPGQYNRSNVKITRVVWIFSRVCSIACWVCLRAAAYRVTYDLEINELFASAVRMGAILVDHQSTNSFFFLKLIVTCRLCVIYMEEDDDSNV